MKIVDLFRTVRSSNIEPFVITNREIFESPQYIPDHDFNLSDKSENIKVAKQIIEHGTFLRKWKDGYSFYRFDGVIGLVNPETNSIIYLLNFQEAQDSLINERMAIQTIIWRDINVGLSRGVPEYVFLNILLLEYGTISTDNYHTRDGHKFWIKIINNVVGSPTVNTYYVEYGDSPIVKKINSIKEFEQLSIDRSIWSNRRDSADKLIVISTKQLKEIKND